jgi:hypothetical protein
MPTEIKWICLSEHVGEQLALPGPTVTMTERQWSYCRAGGTGAHSWRAADSLSDEELERFGPPADYARRETHVE